MSIKVVKDSEGIPTEVAIKSEGRLYKVSYDRDNWTFDRNPTSRVLEMLRLVYPAQKQMVLSIPEPLQVVTAPGGRTVLSDDMEGLLKWTQDTATVSKDNTNAYEGSNCLSVAAAAGGVASAVRSFPMPPSLKLELELVFGITSVANLEDMTIEVSIADGSQNTSFFLRLTTNMQWAYIGPGFVWNNIPAFYHAQLLASHTSVGAAWHGLKMGMDFANNTWLYIQVDHKRTLISGNAYTYPSAGVRSSWIDLEIDAVAGQATTGLFDNVVLRELP